MNKSIAKFHWISKSIEVLLVGWGAWSIWCGVRGYSLWIWSVHGNRKVITSTAPSDSLLCLQGKSSDQYDCLIIIAVYYGCYWCCGSVYPRAYMCWIAFHQWFPGWKPHLTQPFLCGLRGCSPWIRSLHGNRKVITRTAHSDSLLCLQRKSSDQFDCLIIIAVYYGCYWCCGSVYPRPYMCWIVLGIRKNMFAFCINSERWDGAGSWNCSLWMTRTGLFYIVNTIAADGLAMQRARASAAVELT